MYNEVNNKKKFIIPAIAILAVLVIAIVVGIILNNNSKIRTEITVLVVPTSAKVEINGAEYKNGTVEIKPGTYTAKISADGFESKEVEVVAEKDKIALLYEYLTPTTGKYSLEDYDLLKYLSADKKTDALIEARVKALAFLDLLPLYNYEKEVYITNQSYSEECTEDPYLCIGITSLGSASKSEALELIREKGYDPDEFVVFFEQGTSNYYEGE